MPESATLRDLIDLIEILQLSWISLESARSVRQAAEMSRRALQPWRLLEYCMAVLLQCRIAPMALIPMALIMIANSCPRGIHAVSAD